MSEFCGKCGTPYRPDDGFCGKCGAPRVAGPSAAMPAASVPANVPSGGTAQSGGLKLAPLLMAIVLPAVGAAIFFSGVGDCSGETEGNMRVNGARGNFTFTPTGCASMQPYGRFGANLHGEGNNDGAVYVTQDPTRGSAVEIEIPGSCRNADGSDCNVFPVPRDQCSVFQVQVDHTGTTVNDVRLVEGSVRLNCQLTDGTTVNGSITFGSCG
jgi:hypothetical protein